MIAAKEALQSLVKAIEGTMVAAKLSSTSKKAPESLETITYTGEFGEVELTFEDNVLNVNCKAEGQEKKNVASILFDIENPEWNEKDVKSTANVICEVVSKYYGTECVYPGKSSKSSDPAISPEIAEFLEKGKQAKKKKAEKSQSYEAEDLAHRFEVIYPTIKGSVDENTAKYEKFLPEEFFGEIVTPLLLEDLKLNNKQTLKKAFNAFNTFYEEGSNNVQSLVAVSLVAINLVENEEYYKNCESLMDDNLKEAVDSIIKFFKTSAGKKQLAKLTK